MHFDEAVQAAGYKHHSDFRLDELFDEAPYYGKILDRYVVPLSSNSGSADEELHGRIANPTVHVGLNQLRQLLNAVIRAYGHPTEIVVELARELKQTWEERRETTQRQTENQKRNERCKTDLSRRRHRDDVRRDAADAAMGRAARISPTANASTPASPSASEGCSTTTRSRSSIFCRLR